MRFKTKSKCEICDVLYRSLRNYKGEYICYKCYLKKGHKIIGGPPKFSEPLKPHNVVPLNITDTQYEFFRSRLKELNLTRTAYIRELIINDMGNQQKMNEEKE